MYTFKYQYLKKNDLLFTNCNKCESCVAITKHVTTVWKPSKPIGSLYVFITKQVSTYLGTFILGFMNEHYIVAVCDGL